MLGGFAEVWAFLFVLKPVFTLSNALSPVETKIIQIKIEKFLWILDFETKRWIS